jgi:hypothetical protein
MAALVLARIVGGWAELYELGDCAAFALAENGGVERLTAAEAQAGAVESGASIAARQGVVGFSPKAIWQDRLSALQREREGQLSRPTLRVSTPAAGAKFGGVESTRQLGDRAVLVLMSDGYERFAAKYGLGDEGAMIRRSVTEGPERILAEIRALETVDPECRRFARLNPSDDATCLVLAP